jgi:hypothetical protein
MSPSRVDRLGWPASYAQPRIIRLFPTFRPTSTLAIVSAIGIGRLPFGPEVERAGCVGVQIGGLEGCDVAKPIDHAPPDLEIWRPETLPPPLFEGPRRDQPTLSQSFLIKMLHYRGYSR